MTAKKICNVALIYAVAAMVHGVFYREFTKIMGFQGKTSLAVTHVHLFLLGAVLYLVLALTDNSTGFLKQKKARSFLILYNIALPFMVLMFDVRGVLDVLQTPLSKGVNAAISGIAGIAHILMAVSIVTLFLGMRAALEAREQQAVV